MGLIDVIAGCIARMRSGACASCDNRAVCPAGRWRSAFKPQEAAPDEKRPSDILAALMQVFSGAPAKKCFRGEVERTIEPMLMSGDVSIDRVARNLGISRQTLYRRLREEGATFEQLLEAKRRQLAIKFLRFDRLSVKAAAYRLGFFEPAAFSRAFKRWTGISPSEFRGAEA